MKRAQSNDTPDAPVHHSELKGDRFTIMAADSSSDDVRSNISLHIACDSPDEIERYCQALAEGGSVHCGLGPAYGGLYAQVTDRFGVTWYLTSPLA